MSGLTPRVSACRLPPPPTALSWEQAGVGPGEQGQSALCLCWGLGVGWTPGMCEGESRGAYSVLRRRGKEAETECPGEGRGGVYAQGTAWQEIPRGSGWWGGQSMAVVTVKRGAQ